MALHVGGSRRAARHGGGHVIWRGHHSRAPAGAAPVPGVPLAAPTAVLQAAPSPDVPEARAQRLGPWSTAAPPGRYYLRPAATLGWNGSVVTSYGYSVVGFAAAPEARTGGGDPPRVPAPARPRRARRQGTAAYDDQAARPSRHGPPSRPVEVRRVRRVVRRVSLRGLARCAVLLYLCAGLVYLAAVVGLWLIASRSGAVPNVERFVAQLFALKKFQPPPRQLLLAASAVGAAGVAAAVLATVVLGLVFNLISDVVGGVEFNVIEEVPLDKAEGGRPAAGSARLMPLMTH